MTPDLETHYLGMELETPLVASASPLTGDPMALARLEEAGAGAVVLPSLFEEQIEHEQLSIHHLHQFGAESSPEARDYFPDLREYNTGPDAYLRSIERAKESLSIPVIASLNGSSPGGWTRYSKLVEEAGADALELNVYFVPAHPDQTGADVEDRYVELVEQVRATTQIPLAVKIGPSFSSPANMALKLVDAGADGLVLFNRFLRPDMDLEELTLVPSLELSRSYEMRIPLQWIGILREHTQASLAATSGVQEAEDVIKLLLVGADAVMTTSLLLRKGPSHLATLIEGVRTWMADNEYESVEQMKGSMSRANCPVPSAYERGNYMKTLVSFRSEWV
jgi:dihydroorotate dehydrogenase (fumarate)